MVSHSLVCSHLLYPHAGHESDRKQQQHNFHFRTHSHRALEEIRIKTSSRLQTVSSTLRVQYKVNIRKTQPHTQQPNAIYKSPVHGPHRAAAAPTLALAAARSPGFALLFLKKTQEPLRVFPRFPRCFQIRWVASHRIIKLLILPCILFRTVPLAYVQKHQSHTPSTGST